MTRQNGNGRQNGKVKRTPAQIEAARRNGRKGGRPRETGGEAELRRVRERAREKCREELLACVRFWIKVRNGKVRGATIDHKMRAAAELADRGGMPRLTQQENIGDGVPVKLIDLRGFDEEGAPIPDVAPGDSTAN